MSAWQPPPELSRTPPPGHPSPEHWLAPDIVPPFPQPMFSHDVEDDDDVFPSAPRYCNVGAPMGRRETQELKSSLLGRQDFHVRMPLVMKAGLSCDDPAQLPKQVRALLEALGTKDPSALRERFRIPVRSLIVRPAPETFEPLRVGDASEDDVLFQALILGLCTANLYDPRRPVIWTANSLSRRVALFEPEGFYL